MIVEATIRFDTLAENPEALVNDPSTTITLRPALNFGNDLLFSGTIIADAEVTVIERGGWYRVTIEMPTVEREAYEAIRHLVGVGREFTLQLASRKIGIGRIIDFAYGDS